MAMTVKLVVLYTHPEDPAAFDQHYVGTHMPLVHKVPGLQRAETGRLTTFDRGEKTYYRVAELYFADRDSLMAMFGSDEGKAMAADYQAIAPEGSRLFIGALDE